MLAVTQRPLSVPTPGAATDPDRSQATADLAEQLAVAAGPADREAAVQRLIEVNLSVADAIAGRYAGRGVPDDDLAQVARLALVRAARGFDPDLGYDFLGYAVPSIRGELRRYFRDCGWTVRPPRRVQEAQLRMNRARGSLSQDLGREPAAGDFAAALDLDEATVLEALRVNDCYHPDSLDRPVEHGAGAATQQSPAPLRLGEEDPNFARCEARVLLTPLLAELVPRDRTVLRLRFVEGLTQREIGDQIGVTQMQVSRILSRLLGHLRSRLNAPAPAAASA